MRRLLLILLLACAALSMASPAWSVPASGNDRQPAARSATKVVIRADANDLNDPFDSAPSAPIAKDRKKPPSPVAPVDVAAYVQQNPRPAAQQAKFQLPPATTQQTQTPQAATMDDPCRAMALPPLAELGINISIPDGQLPNDFAAACWGQINTAAGPLADLRAWKLFVYHWDATAFCHRPLYFEEVNLERYGYGCGCCLQPLASAAHFFGTVPALPYCMAVDCPHECIYTLGHYRPGSCPPWRHHWPPCDPLAAAAEGGVWTGMIFLIP